MISVVNLTSNTAYTLEARQTIDEEARSRVDLYAKHAIDRVPHLKQLGVENLAGDAYYSKEKFVNPVVAAGLHIVSKLRVDADLRWLYAGDYQGQGRPRTYDGKVVFEDDLARFDLVDKLDNGMQVYSGIVYSNCLKRKIRLVMFRWVKGNKVGRALLFSTYGV